MTTGFIAPAGDLDVLFKARTSTKIADVGFLSNGGVDISNRFEGRGSTTAIANTNFKSGANDLATLFMDIAASVDTISIANQTASSFTGPGTTATAQYQLQSDGDIQATSGTNTTSDTGDWIAPKTNMALYSARATLTSGTLTSGTTGTWLNLASTRTWSVAAPSSGAGIQSAVITLEIRLDSSGIVQDTATITFQAEQS